MAEFFQMAPIGLASLGMVIFILGGIVTAVWKGLLIPRPIHEDRMADKDKENAHLREADKENRETISGFKESNQTIIQLLEGMQRRHLGGDDPR